MKYSVLMSVYKNDSPVFLKQALESIYEKQTRKPDEIVVVFDGPLTEELYAVLDAFKVEKENIVRYLPQETNQGLGEALRIGSEACTGDYIFRMDADDISHENRFKRQSEYVEAHPEIDVLGTDIMEFRNSPDEGHLRIRRCPATYSDIVKRLKTRNPMNHPSVCIKKSALERSGGYRPLLLLEDHYLWLNMIFSGCKLININESLLYMRAGGDFELKRGSKERIVGWWILQKCMVEHGLINRIEAIRNMIYIWTFIHTPPWLKNLLYEKLFRVRDK